MKKKIIIVIGILVVLSLAVGGIASVLNINEGQSSVAIIGGEDGPTAVYYTDEKNKESHPFLLELRENKFLHKEIITDLTEFSLEEDSEGLPLYYWRSYGESKNDVVHKVEMIENKGELIRYHYKNYNFNVPQLNSPMSMEAAAKLVDKFAKQYIAVGEDLSFKNEPSDHTLYDPEHVELWFVDHNSHKYAIAIDLDMGSVIYFEKL